MISQAFITNQGDYICIQDHASPIIPKTIIIKAVFSEENYIPQTAIGAGKHAYCPLLCHNVPSIISRDNMHKHNISQTLKLQSAVVTVNIRSR